MKKSWNICDGNAVSVCGQRILSLIIHSTLFTNAVLPPSHRTYHPHIHHISYHDWYDVAYCPPNFFVYPFILPKEEKSISTPLKHRLDVTIECCCSYWKASSVILVSWNWRRQWMVLSSLISLRMSTRSCCRPSECFRSSRTIAVRLCGWVFYDFCTANRSITDASAWSPDHAHLDLVLLVICNACGSIFIMEVREEDPALI